MLQNLNNIAVKWFIVIIFIFPKWIKLIEKYEIKQNSEILFYDHVLNDINPNISEMISQMICYIEILLIKNESEKLLFITKTEKSHIKSKILYLYIFIFLQCNKNSYLIKNAKYHQMYSKFLKRYNLT